PGLGAVELKQEHVVQIEMELEGLRAARRQEELGASPTVEDLLHGSAQAIDRRRDAAKAHDDAVAGVVGMAQRRQVRTEMTLARRAVDGGKGRECLAALLALDAHLLGTDPGVAEQRVEVAEIENAPIEAGIAA